MGTRVYVGNLPQDVREREVEDLFYKYGKIRAIDLKFTARPPSFGFVEFDDPRDAEDAVRGRDGYDFYGNRLRVRTIIGMTLILINWRACSTTYFYTVIPSRMDVHPLCIFLHGKEP